MYVATVKMRIYGDDYNPGDTIPHERLTGRKVHQLLSRNRIREVDEAPKPKRTVTEKKVQVRKKPANGRRKKPVNGRRRKKVAA